MGDPTDRLAIERDDLVRLEQPAETPLDSQHLPPFLKGGEYCGTDDGVKARCVTASRRDGNPHSAPNLLGDEACDLSRFRMPAKFELRENEIPIDGHLEGARRRFDQTHVGTGVVIAKLSRQTGGSRFVVSDDAVLDGDNHAVGWIP